MAGEDDPKPEELEIEEGLEEEAGDEGDDALEEGEDEGNEGQLDAEPPRRGRYDARLENLRQQARESQERQRELEAQLRQFQQDSQQRQRNWSEEAERERLANMSLEERLEYNLQRADQQQRQFEQQQQFVMADQEDRARFGQLVEQLPELKNLAPQVESELNALRTQRGWNVPRQLVVATLLGMQTLQAMSADLGKQRKKGQENIRRQKTPSAGGQSDVGRKQRRETTPAERLENAVF